MSVLPPQVERFLDEQEPLEEEDEAEQASAEEDVEVAAPKKKGGGGFSRPCALSQPLQAFLGEEMLARSEVGGVCHHPSLVFNCAWP
jgi:hypothetical protein